MKDSINDVIIELTMSTHPHLIKMLLGIAGDSLRQRNAVKTIFKEGFDMPDKVAEQVLSGEVELKKSPLRDGEFITLDRRNIRVVRFRRKFHGG